MQLWTCVASSNAAAARGDAQERNPRPTRSRHQESSLGLESRWSATHSSHPNPTVGSRHRVLPHRTTNVSKKPSCRDGNINPNRPPPASSSQDTSSLTQQVSQRAMASRWSQRRRRRRIVICSSPPQTTPNSLLLTRTRRTPCATPPAGIKFGHLAESSPHTGYEPKSCIDVSSERTPINHASRTDCFNIENDLTTTVAASENSDSFHKHAAARGSPQPVPASVVNPWLGAGSWSSTWQQVRGNAANACVKGTLSRGTRDQGLERLSDRQNLHVYLEQKADLGVQGECAAQRRLSEAEADMSMIHWEQRVLIWPSMKRT